MGMSNPFKLLSDKLDKRIKDGPLDPIKNKKKSLKQEADTSFQACKSQLGKISKSLKKDGLTIDQYVEEYGDALMGADGNPIEGLTSDILRGTVKTCLSTHHSKFDLSYDNTKNKWRGKSKLGDAVEDIIDEWGVDFKPLVGGTIGNTYRVMKGDTKMQLGSVKKTGRNMYQFTTKFKDYAFKGGDITDDYLNSIKKSISTDKNLNVKKIKGGTAIFSLV